MLMTVHVCRSKTMEQLVPPNLSQHQLSIRLLVVTLLSLQTANTVNICPGRCSCQHNNTIIICTGKNYLTVPTLSTHVYYLSLARNKITMIQNSSFTSIPHVEQIHLQENQISVVEEGAFWSLSELQVINLSQNKLSHLPRRVFYGNKKMRFLDLSGNQFQTIPHEMMYDLNNIKVFNISFNAITSPMLGEGFQFTKKLKILDLSGNKFNIIDAHVFQATLWWDKSVTHSLNLSYCDIQFINKDAFSKLYRLDSLSLQGNTGLKQSNLQLTLMQMLSSPLKTLDMSHMKLKDIHFLFARFNHRHLRKLHLHHNDFKVIKPKTFYFLPGLKELDISYNKLQFVGDLSGLNRLQILKMSHNKINSVTSRDFEGLPKIKFIDLSFNLLQAASDVPFQKLFFIEEINLNNNNLSHFTVSTGFEHLKLLHIGSNNLRSITFLQRLPSIKVLDISKNKIPSLTSHTCLPGQEFTLLNLSHNSIREISDTAFQGCPLQKIDLSHNHMSHLQVSNWLQLRELYLGHNDLENIIFLTIETVNNLETLDISYNVFTELPDHVFNHTIRLRSLVLDGNPYNLDSFYSKYVMFKWKKVQHISLSNLSLPNVPEALIYQLPNLRNLILSYNNLTNFRLTSIQKLKSLKTIDVSHNMIATPSKNMLSLLENLKYVDLSHNPFECNCNLMNFKTWLDSHSDIVKNLECDECYQCSSPSEWESVYINHFHIASFSCTHQEKVVILAVISCALLAILLIVAVGIHRRRKWVRKRMQRAHYRSMYDSFTLENPNRHEHIEFTTSKII